MIIGFTGTREGLTNQRLAWLYRLFEDASPDLLTVHHGACVGADASVHSIALEAGVHIHVWPPVDTKYLVQECLSSHELVTVHHAMPYLVRDREIVRAAGGLVALPKQNEQPDRLLWGDTWYTVNFAERMNKPVTICYPNGVVEQRHPTPQQSQI